MLDKALTYCLQEETHVSFADLMDIQPHTTKQQKVQSQTVKVEIQTLQQKFIKQSSIKEMIQASQELKKKPRILNDFSPYQSDWQKNVLNKYYNTNMGNNSFCNKTRRRAFSIQMNSKRVNLRIRDMSMFTDRKQQLDLSNQF